MYRFTILIALFLAMLAQQTRAEIPKTQWYVLLVGATDDTYIQTRKGIRIGYNMAKNNVNIIAKAMGYELILTEINGAKLSAQAVTASINQIIKQASLDAHKDKHKIFNFISITHGTNFQNTETSLPYILCHNHSHLATAADMLSIKGITDAIFFAKPFDNVHIWVEACNDLAQGHQQAPLPLVFWSRSPTNKSQFHSLLTNEKLTIICAASYQNFAYVSMTEGGAFGNALWASLNKVMEGKLQADWKVVFADIEKYSQEFAKTITNDQNVIQIPIFYNYKIID
ncbi:MAG: hypothetical protein JJT94_05430 [Bernardetiaceae bacterium]|nr:hypothetical protein [Bernardetiaceae bacterium]